MKKEILRLERVTYKEQGHELLSGMEFSVEEGEIMGLLPINSYGLETLLTLLRENNPLYDGYVYYQDRLVNSWKDMPRSYNKITIIGDKSSLIDGQDVACNIFVLRPGFKKEIIDFSIFEKQLEPYLKEIGVDTISARTPVEKLPVFERIIVELLRAVVAGHKLVVMREISTLLSGSELERMHKIIRFYAERGVAFIYISLHFEEILQICTKAAIMSNGTILKTLHGSEMEVDILRTCSKEYDRKVINSMRERERRKNDEVAASIRGLGCDVIKNLSFDIHKGECIVIQSLDQRIYKELSEMVTGEKAITDGEILMGDGSHRLIFGRDIAVLPEQPDKTMIFPDMSCIDNLCIAVEDKVKGVWGSNKIKNSIKREYEELMGNNIFDKSVDELTQRERYELVYMRIILQKPKVLFCMQPFRSADMLHRLRIWELLEMLLQRGVALIILAVNMADSLSLADRVLRIDGRSNIEYYEKSDFAKLPVSVPWQHLYEQL